MTTLTQTDAEIVELLSRALEFTENKSDDIFFRQISIEGFALVKFNFHLGWLHRRTHTDGSHLIEKPKKNTEIEQNLCALLHFITWRILRYRRLRPITGNQVQLIRL